MTELQDPFPDKANVPVGTLLALACRSIVPAGTIARVEMVIGTCYINRLLVTTSSIFFKETLRKHRPSSIVRPTCLLIRFRLPEEQNARSGGWDSKRRLPGYAR